MFEVFKDVSDLQSESIFWMHTLFQASIVGLALSLLHPIVGMGSGLVYVFLMRKLWKDRKE